MTTIIRSNVTLSAPRPGAQILPSLGLSGVTHRWHAEAVPGVPGNSVTVVPDNIGNAPLVQVTGMVKLREAATGARYLDFGAPVAEGETRNRIEGPAAGDSNEEWALTGLVYWEPAPGTAYAVVGTGQSAIQGISLEASKNRIAAYRSTNTPTVWTEPSPRQGWHTVAVSYRKNGEETVSLDGGPVASGDVHAAGSEALSISAFGMTGVAGQNVKIIDFAFVNHALTVEEHRAVHAALAAQIPR